MPFLYQLPKAIMDLSDKTPDEVELRDNYLTELHKTILNLDETRFIVRKELRHVKEYSNESKWLNLSKSDVQEINTHLSHLQPPTKGDDELARRFDMLALVYQIVLLTGSGDTAKYMGRIFRTAVALEKKDNIPQVSVHLPLIKQLQTDHL